MKAKPDSSQERIDKPTPSGGAYSIAYFYDAARKGVPKAEATGVEIVEFDAKDVEINRTYLTKGEG